MLDDKEREREREGEFEGFDPLLSRELAKHKGCCIVRVPHAALRIKRAHKQARGVYEQRRERERERERERGERDRVYEI